MCWKNMLTESHNADMLKCWRMFYCSPKKCWQYKDTRTDTRWEPEDTYICRNLSWMEYSLQVSSYAIMYTRITVLLECACANLLKCWKNMLRRIECADLLKKYADGNPLCWFADVLTQKMLTDKKNADGQKTLPARLAWPLGYISRITCSSIMAGAHIHCGTELTTGTCLGRTFQHTTDTLHTTNYIVRRI